MTTLPRLLATTLLVIAAAAVVALPRDARAEDVQPQEVQGIEIIDHRGHAIPKEAFLTDQDGKRVRLGDYFDGKHPVALVLAYYQCPMLCSLVLNGVQAAASALQWTPGNEYKIVTISFDTRDNVETAKKKRETYIKAYGKPLSDHGWDFLVGDETTVRSIADAIGFQYRWDKDQQQFMHAAGLFIMTPAGVVSQVIPGVTFQERTVRLALTDASQGQLGTTWDRIVLLCYHYDPYAKSYVIAATRLMRVAGALTVLILGTVLAILWRRDRRRHAIV